MPSGLTSFSRLAESDSLRELWLGNGAYGWLIGCALVAAVALVASLPVLSRIGAAAGALAGITALLVRPVADAGADVSAGVFASAAVLLALLWVWRRGVWGEGARLAALLPAVATAAVAAPTVAVVAVKCLAAAVHAWSLAPYDHPDVGGFRVGTSPAVTIAVPVALAVVAWLLVLARLPSALHAAVGMATAVALGVLAYDIPLVALVGVLLALALAAAVVVIWRRDAVATAVLAGCVPWLLLAAAGSAGLTALVSAVLGVLFGVLSGLRSSRNRLSGGCAALAVWLLVLSVAADIRLLGGATAARGIAVTAVSAAAFLAAQTLPRVRRNGPRSGVELSATVAAAVGFALAAADPTALAVALSLGGGGGGRRHRFPGSADRRLVSVPGGLLLTAASWVRLVEADIDVVEAFIAPLLAGAGVVAVIAVLNRLFTIGGVVGV